MRRIPCTGCIRSSPSSRGTFHPLASSSAGWAQALEITADDRVAVLGQGLVGNLVMQFARRFRPAQLIARGYAGAALPHRPRGGRAAMASTAMAAMAAGEVQVQPLVTHRLPGRELKAGYDLLYEHPEQALGVRFLWE